MMINDMSSPPIVHAYIMQITYDSDRPLKFLSDLVAK